MGNCLGTKQSLTDGAGDFESKYKQIQLLGRGSFGDVVEAEHFKSGKHYAVKKMKITDKNRKMVDFGTSACAICRSTCGMLLHANNLVAPNDLFNVSASAPAPVTTVAAPQKFPVSKRYSTRTS